VRQSSSASASRSVAQARELAAAFANLVEGAFDLFFFQR
jgi:hypothetical protein